MGFLPLNSVPPHPNNLSPIMKQIKLMQTKEDFMQFVSWCHGVATCNGEFIDLLALGWEVGGGGVVGDGVGWLLIR